MSLRMKILPLGLFLCLLLWTGSAQPILIDEMVQAGDLICFPVYGDSMQYRYLPSRGRLAVNDQNLPEFSFLQYAVERQNNDLTGSAITEADGGGLVHFLVLYDTPDSDVRRAQSALRRKLEREVVLTGPVNFSEGNFLLVSSILRNGKEEKELLGTGRAPVFENSKVAFSFLIPPRDAQLLMESFKMNTPDISITFDLLFEGLTHAYEGELIVDWSLVEKASYYSQSVDAIFYSRDVEEIFGSLVREGAISLRTVGKDSIADELMNIAYDRLLKMMFNPVRPEELPEEKTTGFLEDVFGRRGLLGGLFGGSEVYKKRTIKTSGKTVVNINTRKNAERHHLITFNIGNLYKEHGDNTSIFKKVAIDDPTFQQREILLNLDGSLSEEFEDMLSSVSVTMRKEHMNGEETLREVFLNKELFKEYDGYLKMIYLNKGDENREKWLDYKYQVSWQFKKGSQHTIPWKEAKTPVINLYTPYKYRNISLYGDHDLLKEQGVVAVNVEIEYPFFGQQKRERQKVMVGKTDKEYELEAVLPQEINEVDYTITWIFKNRAPVKQSGKDEYGVILIDEIPDNEIKNR